MFALLLVLLAVSVAGAQGNGIPVDIPGTDVNFFLYRYEGANPPYDALNTIWGRLSTVFTEWVITGQDPTMLSPDDVEVRSTNGQTAIFLKDVLIVEIDDYHSQINRATKKQLGEMWASNLKKGVQVFVQTNQVKR